MNVRGYTAAVIPKSEWTYKAQPSCQPITASALCTREPSPGAAPRQQNHRASTQDLGPCWTSPWAAVHMSLPTMAAWCPTGQGPEPATVPQSRPPTAPTLLVG